MCVVTDVFDVVLVWFWFPSSSSAHAMSRYLKSVAYIYLKCCHNNNNNNQTIQAYKSIVGDLNYCHEVLMVCST